MMMSQYECFPQTRYLGSKRKLLPILADVFSKLDFERALDPFSGTGAVSYLLKSMGKEVTAGDTMGFNTAVARALVVNQTMRLGNGVKSFLDKVAASKVWNGFIENTFDGIFYPSNENRFLDRVLDVVSMYDGIERDMLLFCVGQAALIKRPYNLFHRANLNMRERDVVRSFGNKTTWETPFETLIFRLAEELDSAIFNSGISCCAVNADAMSHRPQDFDLVYLDPPYVSQKGTRVDYIDYYHFLEGLNEPSGWDMRVLHRYRHKPMIGKGESPWSRSQEITQAFEDIIEKFRSSILVISYRSDGIPSIETLVSMLEKVQKRVLVVDVGQYTYALSTNRRSKEIILLGQ